MQIRIRYFWLMVLVVFSGKLNYAQEFGFGCFGLVGMYAGYETQIIKSEGLNKYIETFNTIRADSIEQQFPPFDELKGFRFGLNIYQIKYEGFSVKFKSFFQRLSSKKQTLVTLGTGERQNNAFEFVMNNFGIGTDVTTPITRMITWKILDFGIVLHSASFVKTVNTATTTFLSKDFKSSETSFGYSIGTGFILHLIEEYISVEGTASYSFFTVKRLRSGESEYLTVDELSPTIMTTAVENGGLNTLIQINIGFPF